LRSFRPPSSDNIERVEVLKGPAAVLFGESAPGGGINFISKKARFTDMASLQLQAGSFSRMKGVVDLNSVIRDDVLAFRFVGSYEDSESFTDFEKNTRWMVAPSLVYRPFDGTRIEISYEMYDVERDGHLWNGAYMWKGPDNLGGNAFDGGTGGSIGVHPAFDLDDNVFPNSFYEDQNQAFIAVWEQQVTDWLLNRLVFAYTDGDNQNGGAIVNDRALVFGSPGDPDYVFDPDTLNMVVARAGGNRNTERVLRDELVAMFDGAGGTHSLILGYGDVEDRFTRRSMVNNNKYRDNADPYAIAWNAVTKEYFGMAVPGAIDLRDEELKEDIKQRADRTGLYATLQSRLMEDRLVLLAGIRRHEYERYNLLNAPGNQSDGDVSDTTPQLGVSFEVVPAVTVFGSYSESYRPQLGEDELGGAFDPLAGEGYEAGVKVELMEGKLVGTASYFDNTLTGLLRFDWNFVKPDGTTGGLFSSGEEQSKGVDFDLVYSPIPNWQTVIGLTLLDTEILSNKQTPSIEGLRTINAAETYATLWSKYTFTEGDMEGLWIAGGMSYTGGGRIARYNWAFTHGSYTLVDLAAGYKFSAGNMPMEIQVNAKNITDERYFVYDTMPGRPFEWQLTLRMEF
jgi:iron complex outermembrane receptor protein